MLNRIAIKLYGSRNDVGLLLTQEWNIPPKMDFVSLLSRLALPTTGAQISPTHPTGSIPQVHTREVNNRVTNQGRMECSAWKDQEEKPRSGRKAGRPGSLSWERRTPFPDTLTRPSYFLFRRLLSTTSQSALVRCVQ